MNILTSSYTLDLAGVPTFTLTMVRELERQGHSVTVYSPFGGKLEDKMNIIRNLDELPTPDVIVAQHTPCAEVLRDIFPQTPLVFYSHGLLPEVEQPPEADIDLFFAINEEVCQNLMAKGVPVEKIRLIRDFVDTQMFSLKKPLNKSLKRVLFISNYKKWKNFKTVEGACKILGVNLKCCGAPYGRCKKVEEAINEADLVVSWGRGILEAMACGRAVISFDKDQGDGYIDEKTYFAARKDNFSGRIFKYSFTPESLAAEMQKYNSSCSQVNRDLVARFHEVQNGVKQIIKELSSLVDS